MGRTESRAGQHGGKPKWQRRYLGRGPLRWHQDRVPVMLEKLPISLYFYALKTVQICQLNGYHVPGIGYSHACVTPLQASPLHGYALLAPSSLPKSHALRFPPFADAPPFDNASLITPSEQAPAYSRVRGRGPGNAPPKRFGPVESKDETGR